MLINFRKSSHLSSWSNELFEISIFFLQTLNSLFLKYFSKIYSFTSVDNCLHCWLDPNCLEKDIMRPYWNETYFKQRNLLFFNCNIIIIVDIDSFVGMAPEWQSHRIKGFHEKYFSFFSLLVLDFLTSLLSSLVLHPLAYNLVNLKSRTDGLTVGLWVNKRTLNTPRGDQKPNWLLNETTISFSLVLLLISLPEAHMLFLASLTACGTKNGRDRK